MKKLFISLFSLPFLTGLAFGYGHGGGDNESDTHGETIVEIAAGEDNFSTLVVAVQAGNLAETLSGDGPFTVFAPTNEAFDELPEGTLEFLLEEENQEMLVSILTYHVVPGKVMSADVETGAVETVNGAELDIVASEDGVTVGAATVIETDIVVSNGVIHVIDSVLLPPEE